jgi:hypothetical protein
MVADDERIGAAVFDVDVMRHGLAAVYGDEEQARFVEPGTCMPADRRDGIVPGSTRLTRR